MKKTSLKKDFYIEIKKSLGRFLSIFFIVALGVSLFSGIGVSQNDMILSGDAYVDENNLMDIKIMGSYGMTQDDVDAIASLPSIEKSIGAYSADVLCKVDDNMKVLHVMSYIDDINKVTVSKGRLPKDENECVVDEDFLKSSGYKIGDTITFHSGTNDDLKDTFKSLQYTIVGASNSPLYFSIERGSSFIGNGKVSGFALVLPQAFSMPVYSEVFATVKGAKEALSFTDEYNDIVNNAIDNIKLIQNVRCEIRKNELINDAQTSINNAKEQVNSKTSEANSQINKNEQELSNAEWEIKLNTLKIENAQSQIDNAKLQLEQGKKRLAENERIYEQTIKVLQEQKNIIENDIQKIESQIEQLEQPQKEQATQIIQNFKNSLNKIDAQINDKTQQFMQKLDEYKKEIDQNTRLIASQEQQLNKAKQDLKNGSNQLQSGKKELQNAKNEANQQIQDAQNQIKQSESEIDEIKLPQWYIFDRSSIPEYSGYKDNADRVASLALVFPSIFFLVSALISLTTMTRMVEEQRTQIGTLKALGYSKFSIMKKYINYALLATVGGSLFGIIIGEKLFPYIIISTYKIIYPHIPHIIVPYNLGYAIIATLIAVLCTSIATISSCYKELISQPATLMRPQAPKIGKRILLERVPLLWKRLNFSWKSSLRNLFRYKKRFFMILLGIGGCMGLLLVGYGLRDSVGDIATKQFNELQTYDMFVFMSDDMDKTTKDNLEKELEQNSKINAYKSVHMSQVTTNHNQKNVDAYLTVINDTENVDDFFTFRNRITKKRYNLSDDGVILSEKTAKLLGVNVSDTISLSVNNQNEHKVKISAICENYMGHYVYMSQDYYKKIYGNEPTLNNLLIKTDLEDKELEIIGQNILKHDNILNVQYTKDLISQLNNIIGSLDTVIIVLIVVAGMLSFVVLYNLNNININERRRELASLKVLGFNNIEIAHYVYRENIILTILGILVGCVIGTFLHSFTISTIEIESAMFSREISLTSFVISILFTIFFSAFVNFIMYFKLKAINMVESLKSVE